MLIFEMLDKAKADTLLPPLFRILYDNMDAIAPTGAGFDADFNEWFGAVRPAIEKPQRNIILIRRGRSLLGFFQYYVNNTTFMMEELQLIPRAQGTGVFEALYEVMRGLVPESTPFVEAYAHKLNLKSQGILRHLGLEKIGEENNCLHFRGSVKGMFDILSKSEVKKPEYQALLSR